MARYSWEQRKREHHARKMVHHARVFHIRYGNLLITILGLIGGIWLVYNPEKLISLFEDPSLGYVGSFVMGLAYPLGATTPASIAGLYALSKTVNPLIVSGLGTAGALITDFLVFYFIRHKLLDHFDNLAKKFNIRMHVLRYRIQKSNVLKAVITVLAGIILASPIPTEIAVGMLAAVKYDMKRFMLLAFAFQFSTILIITLLGQSV